MELMKRKWSMYWISPMKIGQDAKGREWLWANPAEVGTFE
jgi:hypothetical protein